MRSAAAAALALALAIAGTAAAAGPQLQTDVGTFCADKPATVDDRIATADGAGSVFTASTPPIAIIDTGLDDTVPELSGRTVSPFDATTGDGSAPDAGGHGSAVAGIAAGAAGLVQGISPTSSIMPIRVYNQSGESTNDWMIAGIHWAVDNHATVISISSATLQDDMTAAQIAALTRATTDAFNRGVLVVASMGNDGDSKVNMPAALPHVLAVGGSNLLGSRATFSGSGPWVDLVSPSVSMIAPTSKVICASGYAVANGTSFAAPAVAGAAAVLAQVKPTLTAQQRFDVLRTSAHDIDPVGRDDDTGFGLLNLQAALTAPAPAIGSSPEVDDDPFYVRGANAAGHPVLLAATKKATVTGQISAAKDPSDVYPVRLKKNERLTVSGTASGGENALMSLGLWKPTVGDFDVSNEVGKSEIVSTGGFSTTPALKMQAKATGTYYLSVEAPDPIDLDDPTAVVLASEPYTLTFSRVLVKAKPKKHKKPAKKKGATKR